MKRSYKSWLLLLVSSFTMGWIAQGEATLIKIGGPEVIMTQAQPVQVVIIASNGNTSEQTVYYDPSAGGINIDTSWAGPNASIYIPALGMGYVWYNGYWVNQEGYYWDGSRRVYVSNPQWNAYWNTYWHEHPHGGWHDSWKREDWHDNEGWRERNDNWRGNEGWRGERGNEWRGNEGWRGDRGDGRRDNEGWRNNRDDGGRNARFDSSRSFDGGQRGSIRSEGRQAGGGGNARDRR